VLTNFSSPDADYALLPLIGVSVFTVLPLVIIYIFSETFKCIKRKKDAKKSRKSDLIIEEIEKLTTSKSINSP